MTAEIEIPPPDFREYPADYCDRIVVVNRGGSKHRYDNTHGMAPALAGVIAGQRQRAFNSIRHRKGRH